MDGFKVTTSQVMFPFAI